jgi:hypothetical protein
LSTPVNNLTSETRPLDVPLDDSELRLIGNSAGMRKVRELIGRVAPTDSTVLICGESGCGKELVAESVHAMSPRAGKPFVAINCAAIPATLIEAELFGHERGSFTGAMRTREGVFERANGGTLLLDEITEMPLDLQSRLLRVLETKRLNRVGGSADLPVDVRVIASTNRLPAQAFDEGRLREDIYYRLAVVTIELPPLRERGEDILVLAEFFLGELNLRNGTHKRLSEELRTRFLHPPQQLLDALAGDAEVRGVERRPRAVPHRAAAIAPPVGDRIADEQEVDVAGFGDVEELGMAPLVRDDRRRERALRRSLLGGFDRAGEREQDDTENTCEHLTHRASSASSDDAPPHPGTPSRARGAPFLRTVSRKTSRWSACRPP